MESMFRKATSNLQTVIWLYLFGERTTLSTGYLPPPLLPLSPPPPSLPAAINSTSHPPPISAPTTAPASEQQQQQQRQQQQQQQQQQRNVSGDDDALAVAIATAVRSEWSAARQRMAPARSQAAGPGVTVPNIVHYVFGSSDTRAQFRFAFFCNIAAAALVMAPDEIIMHYEFDSTGVWWAALKHLITMRQAPMPQSVLGASLTNPAHKTDIVRLRSIIDEGGIYFDADVLPVRSFDDLRGNGKDFSLFSVYTTYIV